jgi:2,3-bisphosphoglycerate-independent phosphoglycerate mutase
MKHLVIVVNGLTDQPVAERDNRTPLQLAATPHLDKLAQMGRTGSVRIVPESSSLPAGGETAYLSLLGFDPQSHQASPAWFEALALNVPVGDGETPLCCDFVILQSAHNDMVMKDYTAGRLPMAEAQPLLDALQEQTANGHIRFHPGRGHHHLMVIRHPQPAARLMPPNELIGEGIRDRLPAGRDVKELVFIISQAQIVLHNHPYNKKRRLEGKDMVNSIWLWGNGKQPNLPPFAQVHNKRAALVSASLLFQGMARNSGVRIFDVAGATGFSDTNYKGKVDTALNALDDHDVVYLHIAGVEDASLHGDIDDKILAIEDFDAQVVGPVLAALGNNRPDVRLLLTVGPVCSAVKMRYENEASPFAVYPTKKGAGSLPAFDEEILKSGVERFGSGPELMHAFFKEEL